MPASARRRTTSRAEAVKDDSESLAHDVRAALGSAPVVREVRMFGGLCFILDEKLVLGVMKDGALLVRIDPERSTDLLAVDGAQQAEMGAGRSMGKSWISVSAAGIATEQSLTFWMNEALAYHRTLLDDPPDAGHRSVGS